MSETTESTTIVVQNETSSNQMDLTTVFDVNNHSSNYSSFEPQNETDRIKLYNTVSSPKGKIVDMNSPQKSINLQNVYIEYVLMKDNQTGEMKEQPRVILIDDKFEGYAGVSSGVVNALSRMVRSVGETFPWKTPRKVFCEVLHKDGKNINTLKFVG